MKVRKSFHIWELDKDRDGMAYNAFYLSDVHMVGMDMVCNHHGK